MDTACSLAAAYTPAENDLLLLLFLDEENPCFATEQIPPALHHIRPPKDEGGKCVAYAGALEQGFIFAQSQRLDDTSLPASENLKKAVAQCITTARDEKLSRVVVPLDNSLPGSWRLAVAIQEGALLGGYVFDRYLDKKPAAVTCTIVLSQPHDRDMQTALDQSGIVLELVNQARDLCNEPPNIMHPGTMAERLLSMAKEAGMATEYWDAEKLEEERCHGILSVGKGAANKPGLVKAAYTPENACCSLALVGKGITCDTGGYSIKPMESQVGMKYDMAGAASVFAAACAIARLQLPLAVTVYAPLAENDVSSTAFHVGDVLTMRNGRTVEILNTDAEGRLLLADAICLAGENAPDYLVDAATLTGAAVVGLGEDIAAFFGNDSSLTAQLLAAANECGEAFWELPLFLPYGEKLKATIADSNNTGKSRLGGSIIAALFLKHFLVKGQKWLHLDIAGPGGKEDPLGPLGKGGKGFGVRTLVELARTLCSAT